MINKNAENRDKWFARFMCIFIACCLWVYVMSEQNPIVEKEFAIPLASRNLAEGMIVFNVPEKVSVRVRGTRTALANMPESDICLDCHSCIEEATSRDGSHRTEVGKRSTVGIAQIEASAKSYAHIHLVLYLFFRFCCETEEQTTNGYCCAKPSLFSLPRHTCALVIIQMKLFSSTVLVMQPFVPFSSFGRWSPLFGRHVMP